MRASRARRLLLATCVFLIAAGGLAPGASATKWTLKAGVTGGGTVTSADGRIDCGDDCSARYAAGRRVRLRAAAAPDFDFVRWRGACVGTAPTCVVAADRRSAVRATFDRVRRTVQLVVSGPGMVFSEPPGFTCGSSGGICTNSFGQGSRVRLRAVPDAGGVLDSWGAAGCSPQPVCEVIVPGDFDLATVRFRSASPFPGTPPLTVEVENGHLSSTPVGIDCPPTCSATFPSGTPVMLDAGLAAIWSRDCSGFDPRCTVLVDRPVAVRASIPPPPPPPAGRMYGLNVTVSGPGMVSGGDAMGSDEIRCGGISGTLFDCQHLFLEDTTVRLKAVSKRGGFVRWTSFCRGKRPICTLRITATKTVGAVFRR